MGNAQQGRVDGDRERAEAQVLAGRICAAAGLAAQSECALLELIGEFDELGAIKWWRDVKSLAHWLSWCCSMSPGTAREHVRVGRALRRMPTVATAFRDGHLSYSKVREVTRVVGVVDEARLCELALTATASQLARMIRGFRTAEGLRTAQLRERSASWTTGEDEMVDFRIRLPKDEAAVVIAAVTAAKDQFGAPPPAPCPALSDNGGSSKATPTYGYADAVLDVARAYLATAPEDRSGEDRTMVVVHVAAEALAEPPDVPAGTSDEPLSRSASEIPGAPRLDAATCNIQGIGGIEPETARRLACDAEIAVAVVGDDGEVLALGRTRRLVSRGQRRALMIRDGMCQFAGCHQTRHLRAHHVVPWSQGGLTDLGNLMLLCQFHHTVVHEGRMVIRPTEQPSAQHRWLFFMPDGRPHEPWHSAEGLAYVLAQQAPGQQARRDAVLADVDGFEHVEARRIRPRWAGERFDLHECVRALSTMRTREGPDDQWEAA